MKSLQHAVSGSASIYCAIDFVVIVVDTCIFVCVLLLLLFLFVRSFFFMFFFLFVLKKKVLHVESAEIFFAFVNVSKESQKC